MEQRAQSSRGVLAVIGPGLLVAATGVGAGDLYTAGFAGQKLGVAVLWAVVVGGALKLILNEGLARWQLATGETLLEGCATRLGLGFKLPFGFYLVAWSYFVGAALISACGTTLNALWPLFNDPQTGKVVYGAAASAFGVVVALSGGFRLFEWVMMLCVGVMFVSVVYTAVALQSDWGAVVVGSLLPSIPQLTTGGLQWTLALMGGVGGTLTVIVYGYWMREAGRTGASDLGVTRIDLACGYAMTILFGMAMVVIGSQVTGDGRGAGFVVTVADHLGASLGTFGRVLFLAGANAAVLSSLLGVWQSVPYVFADFVGLVCGDSVEERHARVASGSRTYRLYLLALAIVPLVALRFPFKEVQKVYAVVGAAFMPFLAAVLLYLLGRPTWVGRDLENSRLTNALLVLSLVMFLVFGGLEIAGRME